jgi:hypothetical protein
MNVILHLKIKKIIGTYIFGFGLGLNFNPKPIKKRVLTFDNIIMEIVLLSHLREPNWGSDVSEW